MREIYYSDGSTITDPVIQIWEDLHEGVRDSTAPLVCLTRCHVRLPDRRLLLTWRKFCTIRATASDARRVHRREDLPPTEGLRYQRERDYFGTRSRWRPECPCAAPCTTTPQRLGGTIQWRTGRTITA